MLNMTIRFSTSLQCDHDCICEISFNVLDNVVMAILSVSLRNGTADSEKTIPYIFLILQYANCEVEISTIIEVNTHYP